MPVPPIRRTTVATPQGGHQTLVPRISIGKVRTMYSMSHDGRMIQLRPC